MGSQSLTAGICQFCQVRTPECVPGAPESDRQMPSQGIADEEAVIELRELLSADLTLFATARSTAIIGLHRGLLVVVGNDLFRYDRGFVEMPVTEINNLLTGIRVALTHIRCCVRKRVVPTATGFRIYRRSVISSTG